MLLRHVACSAVCAMLSVGILTPFTFAQTAPSHTSKSSISSDTLPPVDQPTVPSVPTVAQPMPKLMPADLPATRPARTKVSEASTRGGASSNRSAEDPFPAATPQAVVAVTAKVFPAVVRIDVASEVYIDGKRDFRRAIGSGVIIDKLGHILTNFHVAGRAAEIYVTLANKERVPAKLIGDDHWTDLAIIQLDMDTVKRKKISFDAAELGESNSLVPGESVMAIGTPWGLCGTLTLGVVSNNERTFYPQRLYIDQYETGDFSNWIQMDTPINPGNSGGPLVDLSGKVVGINTRGGGENLNFAIPIDTARAVVKKLLASATKGKKGKVDRSDLGIDLKPMQDLEGFYKIDVNRGVLVNSVEHNSPADKAGVHPQDILLEINGKLINVRFPEELASTRQLVADLPIGSDVKLVLRRGDETLDVTAKTQKLQSAIGEEKELKDWGMSVREITRKYATEENLDNADGVVVTSLSRGLAAFKADLHEGDIIHSVNQSPVTDLESFVKLYDASIKAKDATVLLLIQRDRGSKSCVLKVDY